MSVPEWRAARRAVRDVRRVWWGRFTLRGDPKPPHTPLERFPAVKLNVGCGRDVRQGYLNVDLRPYPDVALGSLEPGGLPCPDASVDFVFAHNVLEHVLDFGAALEEIHRVLRVGGLVEWSGPFRKDNENPFHLRRFSHRSLWAIIGPGNTLEGDAARWQPVWAGITERGFPWVQLCRLGLNLPVGRRLVITFVLRKVT